MCGRVVLVPASLSLNVVDLTLTLAFVTVSDTSMTGTGRLSQLNCCHASRSPKMNSLSGCS